MKVSEAFAAWCDGERVQVGCRGEWYDSLQFVLSHGGLVVEFNTEYSCQRAHARHLKFRRPEGSTSHCLRVDCIDHGHLDPATDHDGANMCRGCKTRLAPTDTHNSNSNGRHVSTDRQEIGAAQQPQEGSPALNGGSDGSSGSAEGGAHTGGVPVSWLEEREALIEENVRIRQVIVALHQVAECRAQDLRNGPRHEAVSYEGSVADGWEQASHELKALEVLQLGAEVAP